MWRYHTKGKKMKIKLSKKEIKQLLWAIDLAENTLEDLSQKQLKVLGIGINKKILFELAEKLEGKAN